MEHYSQTIYMRKHFILWCFVAKGVSQPGSQTPHCISMLGSIQSSCLLCNHLPPLSPLWLQSCSCLAVWPQQWGPGSGPPHQPSEPSDGTPWRTQHPAVHISVHPHEEVVHSEYVGGVSCRGDTSDHGMDGVHGRHPQRCTGHGGHVVCLAVSSFQFVKLERAWGLQKGRVQDDGTHPP